MPRTGPGLAPVAAQLQRDVRLALQAAAVVLQEEVVNQYSTPGRGRLRRSTTDRKGKGSFRTVKLDDGSTRRRQVKSGRARTSIDQTNRHSAPGDPPAPDTGALRSSVQVTQTDTGYRVGTNLEYAPHLEYGTPRIAPRPAWRPAIEKARARMGDAIVATLGRRT